MWVNVPGSGYVGVGIVTQEMHSVDEARGREEPGKDVPLVQISTAAASLSRVAEAPELADYVVRIEWVRTVDPTQAVREKGFFGNQNSVARPRSPKWDHTVEQLKVRLGVE